MTAFITRCCASGAERLRRLLLALLLCVLPLTALGEASVRSAAIISVEEGYVVNADFQLELNSRLVDAVQRGVSLYFTVELIVERPRRFWFDSVIAERRLQYRLSYHAVTRTYRLSIGNLHRSFDTLDAALRTMTRLRSWHVLNHDNLDPGADYRVALRMRHETEMLPKPLAVTATGSREWMLATQWVRWTFSAESEQ